ncbi:glutaminyl-peptide cyclotransferase [Streptomyces sp. NPDC047117]|uniref:glutaminyl-peptide cyclotransferase n=1 Tax=Streptomyces sp. NPDC047117 TaxID=3155379 RepID=UPI0033C2368F
MNHGSKGSGDRSHPREVSSTSADLLRRAGERIPFRVVHTHPHDQRAFTQGIVTESGVLYESTGGWGSSELRKVDIESGNVLKRVPLGEDYFGEGIASAGGLLYQVTFREKTGFVYTAQDLERVGEFSYRTEAWGLTNHSGRLIMSNGTSMLYVVDPDSGRQEEFVQVTARGEPVDGINDIEVIDGCFYANVYTTDCLIRIDPADGRVTGAVDLTGINTDPTLASRSVAPYLAVLNGIAHDARRRRTYVTGKLWDSVYEIDMQ